MAPRKKKNPDGTDKETQYSAVLGRVFEQSRPAGCLTEFTFLRNDLAAAASELGISLPKNLGDVVYSHRYRTEQIPAIAANEPAGSEWVVFGAGRAKYKFVLVKKVRITANAALGVVKIPDSTPEIIRKYKLEDEQSLLAKIRYNRLLDLFLGIVAYPLQSHFRTFVADVGQIEVDEVYVGVNKRGTHFVVPVQAKVGNDRLGIVQVWQDNQLCKGHKLFKHLPARLVGAQLLSDDVIAMFELQVDGYTLTLLEEKHYSLVPHDKITSTDLDRYREATERDRDLTM